MVRLLHFVGTNNVHRVETDKKVLAKEARMKERAEKKNQCNLRSTPLSLIVHVALQRKAENRALAEQESKELAKKYGKPKDTKVTRAIIEEQRQAGTSFQIYSQNEWKSIHSMYLIISLERLQKEREQKKQQEKEQEIEPNYNQLIAEEKAGIKI